MNRKGERDSFGSPRTHGWDTQSLRVAPENVHGVSDLDVPGVASIDGRMEG